MLADRIHLNAAGYRIWTPMIIAQKYPRYSAQAGRISFAQRIVKAYYLSEALLLWALFTTSNPLASSSIMTTLAR